MAKLTSGLRKVIDDLWRSWLRFLLLSEREGRLILLYMWTSRYGKLSPEDQRKLATDFLMVGRNKFAKQFGFPEPPTYGTPPAKYITIYTGDLSEKECQLFAKITQEYRLTSNQLAKILLLIGLHYTQQKGINRLWTLRDKVEKDQPLAINFETDD